MKAFIIFHGRMPSERAAALWAAKTAEAIAESGIVTTLVASDRGVTADPFAAYTLKQNFLFKRLPAINLYGIPALTSLAYWLSVLSFALVCIVYLKRHAKEEDVLFSNEPLVMYLASFFFSQTYFEMHVLPTKGKYFFRILLRRMKGVVAINEYLARTAIEMGATADTTIIARSGVDFGLFDLALSKSEAREKLGIPLEGVVALYTGHLYAWKGVRVLAEAASLMPDVTVIFVGGSHEDVLSFKVKYENTPNVRIVGHVPHVQVPVWQKAADVLILPNTAKEVISELFTSPMKLFEYMTSDRPIVASRVPSITEIISENEAVLVKPDDARSLASGIREALRTDVSSERAHAARAKVRQFSWQDRGARIARLFGKGLSGPHS